MAKENKSKGNVPNLRFQGFEGEWANLRLGEIATFSKGKGISKSDIDDNGNTECIRYGELYTHYGETIDKVKSKTNVDVDTLILSQANDVIIPASGETMIDIATASCVLKSGVALGGDLNIIKTKNDGVFLSYYLNSKKKLEIANLAQGISVVHLYSSQLSSLSLRLPTLEEQKRISIFLATLDKRIQTQNKIIEELDASIRDFRNQIFKQKFRFKNNSLSDFPEWKRTKLDEIAQKRNIKNKDLNIKRVFSNSASLGIINQTDFFDKEIANQNNIDCYYIVEKNDFVYNPRISKEAPVGPISRNKIGTGVMSPLYMVLRFKQGSADFFEQFFKSNIWHEHIESIANYGARADRMSFSKSDFFEMPISIPAIEEQTKIANFLHQLEQKNEIEKQLLERYVNQKQYLLKQMFV
jgi:type I restriction enzyme S subunit